MKTVYLDYAATTYIDAAVFKKIAPYLKRNFGNPSSLYLIGRQAKAAIESARASVAKILGVNFQEIIFTGSGTESDNLAVFGVAEAYSNKGKHIIVSKIEHKAILESARKLEKEGFEITYLGVDSKGLVDLSELKKSLRPDTILVSIMYANNEIGTIQPITEIAKIINEFKKEKKFSSSKPKRKRSPAKRGVSELREENFFSNYPFFHTDACQAAGALPLNIKKLGVDLLTINGSKIYGPKGVGCLYKSKDIKLEPLIVGGGQENNLRAGTENVALIVGFGEALKLAEKLRLNENRRLKKLRDYLIRKILKTIPDSRLNGDPTKRLPNNINVSFKGVEGESLVLMLDKQGVFASTGSACTSNNLDPSHVLLAIGLESELAHGSLRLTLGRKTTKRDLDYVLKILPETVHKLREISSMTLNHKK